MAELLVKDGGLAVSGGAVAVAPCPSCCGAVCNANGLCCGARPYAWPFIRINPSGFLEYQITATLAIRGSQAAATTNPNFLGWNFNIPFDLTRVGSLVFVYTGGLQVPPCTSQGVSTSGGALGSFVGGMLEQNTTWPQPNNPLRSGYLSGGFGGQLPRGGYFRFPGFASAPAAFGGDGHPNFELHWGVEPGLYGAPGWSVGQGVGSGFPGQTQTQTVGTVTLGTVENGFIKSVAGGGFSARCVSAQAGGDIVTTLAIDAFEYMLGIECCNPPDSGPELGPLLDALR